MVITVLIMHGIYTHHAPGKDFMREARPYVVGVAIDGVGSAYLHARRSIFLN